MQRKTQIRLALSALAALTWVGGASESQAGCTPAPTAGNDTIACSASTPPDPTPGTIDLLGGNDRVDMVSGTYGGLTGATGNKTLIFGLGGGNPTITGNVIFGSGRDTIEIHSGTIVGAIDQSGGIDSFLMTGGTIQSLDQGADRDVAVITGGRIIGLFTDGDDFTMTGGRIGLVNLRAGNNIMRMSGGSIDSNVIAEQGDDRLELSGGVIGGFVDFGNGNNTIIVTGGQIGNGIITGTGADQLVWSGAGLIAGPITLGAGTDTATLSGLTSVHLAALTLLDGGIGTDTLTFDGTEATGVARFQRWETIVLSNASRLTLDAPLVLGDAGTGTGTLSIDATSTLFAGGGTLPSIQPFVSGQLVSVINAGTIDLTNGPAAATDRLTIFGNYFGQGGRLLLNTVLAGDGAPSDKLVISGGQGTGTTSIGIINLGGGGALTVADGILVVEAVNGGATAPGAFQLGGPVAAGAYEYLLFRGGVTGGTQDNWYLRSSLVPGSDPPVPPVGPILPPPPAPPPGAAPIPLFRPEVAVYSALPPLARELALATLGTYHERAGGQNDRRPPAGDRDLPQGAWSRTLGGSVERSWAGVVSPSFDGTYAGFQAGQDLLQQKSPSGHRDDAGLYVGFAQTRGDVRGFAVGRLDTPVGSASLDGTSLGAYWTHIGPMRWYVDAVLQATMFDGSAHSIRGVGFGPNGHGLAASLEGGFPIPLAYGLTLEPQAQAIWQRISLNDARDRFSTVAFDADDRATGRVGARLYAPFASQGLMWRPYLKANVWHTFAGDDKAIFAQTDVIGTRVRATALELGGGGTLQLSKRTSIWGDVSYLTDVGGTEQRGVAGSLGFRWAW